MKRNFDNESITHSSKRKATKSRGLKRSEGINGLVQDLPKTVFFYMNLLNPTVS
jgi:hypothetical protein